MKAKSVDFYRLREPIDLEDRHHQDYLRYDRAFVRDDDLALVAFPTLQGPAGKGVYLPGPTVARWPHSFGLSLADGVSLRYVGLDVRILWESPGRWITFRHPRAPRGGAEDYTRLIPITLSEVLSARDLDDVLCPDCGESQKPVRNYAGRCLRTWHHAPSGGAA